MSPKRSACYNNEIAQTHLLRNLINYCNDLLMQILQKKLISKESHCPHLCSKVLYPQGCGQCGVLIYGLVVKKEGNNDLRS